MAMLAERKSKQKLSHDPRNTAWSTDTGRFGYQMLTKMGWSMGKGLGAAEKGSTSHIKVSLKNNNLGVGAKASHDDNWLAHQDDFNELLAELNRTNNDGASKEDSESSTKNNDMETIARKSKKRVFYQRFIKSKNTSSYSAEDMACIMGQRSKSAPDSPVNLSESEDSNDSCASCPVGDLGMKTITSEQNIQEYFAMKMSELKRRQKNNSKDTSNEKDIVQDSLEEKKTDCKQKKREIIDGEQDYVSIVAMSNDDVSEKGNRSFLDSESQNKKKKKDKKRKIKGSEDGFYFNLNSKIDETEDTIKASENNFTNGRGNIEKDELISFESKSRKKKKKKTKEKKEKKRPVLKKGNSEISYNLRNSDYKIEIKSEERAFVESEHDMQESCEKGKKSKKRDRKKTIDEECCENAFETKPWKKKKRSKIESVNIDEENEKNEGRKQNQINKERLKENVESKRRSKGEESRKNDRK